MKLKSLSLGVMASILLAQSVSAQTVAPSLSMSGNAKFELLSFQNRRLGGVDGAGLSLDPYSPSKNAGNGVSMASNGEMNFIVAGLVKGWGYNFLIALSGDTARSPGVSENRIEITRANVGTFQGGNKVGPENVLMIDPSSLIGGAGGFDGSDVLGNVFKRTTGVFLGDTLVGDTGTATKIVYYTPRFRLGSAGAIMAGFSFTPNTSQKGMMPVSTALDKNSSSFQGNDRHVFSAAMNFAGVQKGFAYSFSAAGIFSGKSTGPRITAGTIGKAVAYSGADLKAVQSWQLGAVFGYGAWQLGLGYINNGQSHILKGSSGWDSGQAFSVALSYVWGDYKLTGSYQNSTQKLGSGVKGKGNWYTATFDWAAAPGLNFFAEYDYISMKTKDDATFLKDLSSRYVPGDNAAVGGNWGSVGLLGVKVSF